jgi:lipopolysaccharide export system protein LptA
MRGRERVRGAALTALALALVAATAGAESKRAPDGGSLFDAGSLGNRKEPITITSDTLEFDYKTNVVVYSGDVNATQGNVKLRSDKLTVTLEKTAGQGNGGSNDGGSDTGNAGGNAGDDGKTRVRDIVAVGNVRVDSGTRWATGGKAVFDQTKRTLSLIENPVLHDGVNEVVGERVVVYLDEDRSVVEGGRKRVKAVLYPGQDGGLAPAGGGAGGKPSPTAKAGTP